jgi:hypothetical protein
MHWFISRRTRLVTAAMAAVALLVVGGCSSGSSAPSGSAGAHGRATIAGPIPGAAVAAPTVTGPITGGAHDSPFNPMPRRLADQYGYREQEYFIEGQAQAYFPAGTWASDGLWTATPATTAAYQTRILVRRPVDPSRFNGTVVIEWLNVSSGMDSDPDFGFAGEELMSEGAAWVGVSVQSVGVNGGPKIPIPGFDAKALKVWDPDRYGALVQPGDDFAFDIYSQAAQAIRRPSGVDPLDGLTAEKVLATGESQSAFNLVTYANAIQPIAQIYDGFMIHSRGGGGASINHTSPGAVPKVAHIRADLTVPVMQFETETDLFGLGFATARQPDTDRLRTWEVAGTAHADQSTLDYGLESGRQLDSTTKLDFTALCGTINNGPQRAVARQAFASLLAWVGGGAAPASGRAIDTAAGAIVRDDVGNAQGGVRTPPVDAPISTLSGEPSAGSSVICSLFGSTTPFTAAQLAAHYPDHPTYVAGVTSAADAAVTAGHLLAVDRDAFVAQAEAAAIPG